MRPTLDPRVYLVTGDEVEEEGARRIVAEAVAGGVTLVQLRAKNADPARRADLARRFVSLLAPSGVPLIVNDDIDAARMSGAAGLHVGPDDVHPAEARAALGPEAIIGWSIHDMAQLADEDAIGACDYLAASPVWPTTTKADTTEPFGLDGVCVLRSAMPQDLPLVGIGGITDENAGDLIRAGADGVSIVSAIWASPDPRAAAQRIRVVVDQALAER